MGCWRCGNRRGFLSSGDSWLRGQGLAPAYFIRNSAHASHLLAMVQTLNVVVAVALALGWYVGVRQTAREVKPHSITAARPAVHSDAGSHDLYVSWLSSCLASRVTGDRNKRCTTGVCGLQSKGVYKASIDKQRVILFKLVHVRTMTTRLHSICELR
jgi:hypothetical protein